MSSSFGGKSFSENKMEAPKAVSVKIDDTSILIELKDGRNLSVPLSWYPRLSKATPEDRADFRLIGGGIGIHWPRLDEDLSIKGFLLGNPDLTRPIETSSP